MADFGQRVQSKSKFPEPLPCTTVDPPLIHGDPPGIIGASRSRSRISESESKAYNAPDGDLWFDQFWQAYPRKIGKEGARKYWNKIGNGKRPALFHEIQKRIIEAIKKQVAAGGHWRGTDGKQRIPNPATWLNQGRWDDEIQEEQPHEHERIGPTYVPKQ